MKKPYLATNPRSVNGAAARGWQVVELGNYRNKHNVSFVGLLNWLAREASDYYVAEFRPGGKPAFAFKNHTDAFWFESRWS
jgi:hypothetical protein